ASDPLGERPILFALRPARDVVDENATHGRWIAYKEHPIEGFRQPHDGPVAERSLAKEVRSRACEALRIAQYVEERQTRRILRREYASLRSTEPLQHPQMGADGAEQRVLRVGGAVLARRLADDARERRQVNLRDTWEEMMRYVKVQPSRNPRNETVLSG